MQRKPRASNSNLEPLNAEETEGGGFTERGVAVGTALGRAAITTRKPIPRVRALQPLPVSSGDLLVRGSHKKHTRIIAVKNTVTH